MTILCAEFYIISSFMKYILAKNESNYQADRTKRIIFNNVITSNNVINTIIMKL